MRATATAVVGPTARGVARVVDDPVGDRVAVTARPGSGAACRDDTRGDELSGLGRDGSWRTAHDAFERRTRVGSAGPGLRSGTGMAWRIAA